MSAPFWSETPVRFSHLRAYGRSAAHGRHARIAHKDDPSVAMERGTGTHAILFGNQKVVGYPGATRRGKEYTAFVEQHQDHVILTMTEYDKANRMADAVRDCAVAAPYLDGIKEDTLLFTWMGLKCRSTPDVRGPDFVTELKTSSSADPSKFLWHARRMHYHAQMRFESFACDAKKIPIRDHWIVCVESDAPHPVTVFHVEPEALEEGEKLLILWAERLKNCETSNRFPGYVECAVPLVWPKDDIDYVFPEEVAA